MGIIIGFVSQKGGVGKSSLARAVAREAAMNKLNVKLADLDTQQGTAVKWNLRRQHEGIEPQISVESYGTAQKALAVKDGYDLLILDGPARASTATLDIARQADLLVQPSGPSLDDLEPAVLLFHELVKAGVARNKLVMALNHVGTEAEYADACTYLNKAGYEALDGCLFEKPGYRQAQDHGRAITETIFQSLNHKADTLIQSIIDRIKHG